MGNTAASAGAAGQLTGLPAGRSSGRRRRAVGSAGPFEGIWADREQRTLPSTPPGPQYLSRNYGPGRIRRRIMPEYTSASGRLDHTTFRERADTLQSDARDFEPSDYTPIDRQGSGRVEPNDL
jgi:hypothetical protein